MPNPVSFFGAMQARTQADNEMLTALNHYTMDSRNWWESFSSLEVEGCCFRGDISVPEVVTVRLLCIYDIQGNPDGCRVFQVNNILRFHFLKYLY